MTESDIFTLQVLRAICESLGFNSEGAEGLWVGSRSRRIGYRFGRKTGQAGEYHYICPAPRVAEMRFNTP